MTLIFRLLTFRSCLATFQSHFYTEWIFLNWYATPGFVLLIIILLIEDWSWQESYWAKGFSGKDKNHHSGSFLFPIMICLTGKKYPFTNGYHPTVMNTNPFLHRLWLTSIVTIFLLWLLSNKTGATSEAGVEHHYGGPELTLVFVSSRYSGFSFQCSVVWTVFVFRFILLVLVLSAFRLNDFGLPLWNLQIPFVSKFYICRFIL